MKAKMTRVKLTSFAVAALVCGSMSAYLAATSTALAQSGAPASQAMQAGGVVVEAGSITATVTAIDAAKRKLTLTTPDGTQTTYKAPKDAINFDQIKVGDQVKAKVYEEVAIALTTGGAKLSDSDAGAVALAPVGAKPGVLMADTMQITAQVTKVHKDLRRVTLKFADGKKKSYHVDKGVDLSNVKDGDDVMLRITEAIAISVTKA